jgi:23S rRNA (cytosine1962-C5)-methyltransferase
MSKVPTIIVNKRGAERFRRGHLWVFRSDLAPDPQAAPGDQVRIQDNFGHLLGYGFYGPSQLALRLLTREEQEIDEDFLRRRLNGAINRRRALLGERDALRLVHGESDLLPGLLVDQFGPGVVVQSLCHAMDQREEMVVRLLVELLQPRVVVLRDDAGTRDYESLERRKSIAHGQDSRVTYHEGDLLFAVDLLADQKTGGYLDQYENHLLAGQVARGRALDLFCYHGGFGLQMARRAEQVLCLDQSEAAISRVRDNAMANGITNVEARVANAFDELHRLQDEGARFDTIVIDPPSFAKRKSAMTGALRGYKDLNLRALRLLPAGGLLFSCSCSAKMTSPIFEEMLEDAARDAKRRVIILERRGAGRDHPALLGMEETEYLKCFVLQVLE